MVFPHLDNPALPDNNMANAEKWATGLDVPAYAIDDQTAIQVIDGAVRVISEGHWRRFTPQEAFSHLDHQNAAARSDRSQYK